MFTNEKERAEVACPLSLVNDRGYTAAILSFRLENGIW